MTKQEVASMADAMRGTEEKPLDVEARFLAEFVDFWTHTDSCDLCKEHVLCDKGRRLAIRLTLKAGTDVVHAVAA